MFDITINNRKIKAEENETILVAAKRAGINIPTLCHMEGLLPSGACRICSVEVEGSSNLITACSYPVSNGMKIKTNSIRVNRARKVIVELLLANHPNDCLYCVRNNDCDLQKLASTHNIRERRLPERKKITHKLDYSSAAILRDNAKCVLCGKCVRVCDEVQNVGAIDFIQRGSSTEIGTAFNESLSRSNCINCGQCIIQCPTGAIRERSYLKEVIEAIEDPETTVVIQHAPAISVTIAEEFGIDKNKDATGVLTTVLREIGFDYIFDTAFGADLTIMEEASELIERIKGNGKLPMLTSCCPAWIKYVEHNHHDFIPNLSTCKSPQQMLGAVIKNIFAKDNNINKKKIFSVSIMPCSAKKYEAQREEMKLDKTFDVDAVITTRELVRLIKMNGISLENHRETKGDSPLSEYSGAGKIFGGTGGVMEAALRTAQFMLTGKHPEKLDFEDLRGDKNIKEFKVNVGDLKIGVAVVNGIGNAENLLNEIRNGRDDIHFIEVMTCSGGCVAGGGQPQNVDKESIKSRKNLLYTVDAASSSRVSHNNSSIKELYENALGSPLGKLSHKILHTSYTKR